MFSTTRKLDSAFKYVRLVKQVMPMEQVSSQWVSYYHTMAEYELAENDFALAHANLDSALYYSKKLNVPTLIYICHSLRSAVYLQANKPVAAMLSNMRAKAIAETLPSPEELKECLTIGIEIQKELKNIDSVTLYQGKLIEVLKALDARTIMQQEASMALSARLAKQEYLYSKTESELAVRNAELVASRRLFWLLLCILVAACALALVITRSYRLTLRQKHEISRKQIELEKNKLELEKALRIRTRLHSILAHDFMGGLATLRSVPEVLPLVAKTGDDTYITQFSEALRVKLEATHALLDGLLKWSSLQVTDQYLKLNELRLLNLVQDVANQARPQSNTKQVLLLVEEATDCRRCYVHTNEEGLSFILRNLVVNAIKFSNPEQTVLLRISSADKDHACIEVTDQGVGMDDNQLANLFEVDRSKRRAGTLGEVSSGLGLVFVKEVADGLGIKLEVSSVLNQGTTVKVLMPKADHTTDAILA